jgi:hypothetical protein
MVARAAAKVTVATPTVADATATVSMALIGPDQGRPIVVVLTLMNGGGEGTIGPA